jgi:hypothetical protein
MWHVVACRCGALCFTRTIISGKQVLILLAGADQTDQSGACLRADAQPISGDCGQKHVSRKHEMWRGGGPGAGGRDANQLSRGPLLRPPPAAPALCRGRCSALDAIRSVPNRCRRRGARSRKSGDGR